MSGIPHNVISSGSSHIDIDALACVVAFHDYLTKKGDACEIVLTPMPNATVPPMIRALPMAWTSGREWKRQDRSCRFFVMDVSNPEFFDSVVCLDEVTRVYDHHHGFESYWATRHDVHSSIEPVGACATLVWEEICRTGYDEALGDVSYKLLLTAIASNTLDFRSRISCARDEYAYHALANLSGVGEDWKEAYFKEVSASILADPAESLRRDCKRMLLGSQSLWVGQIEVWNAAELLNTSGKATVAALLAKEGPSFANVVSISEGVNYLFADSPDTAAYLGSILPGRSVTPRIYRTDDLWLRKEIAKEFATRF